MRAPRALRIRAALRKTSTKPAAVEPAKKPEGYRSSPTDGYSSTDRVSRRFESDDGYFYTPIVMGFRPNQET